MYIGVYVARGFIHYFAFTLFVSAIIFLPQTSSRSSLGAVIISLIFITVFVLIKGQVKASISRRIIGSLAILLVLFILVFSGLLGLKDSILFKRLDELKRYYEKDGIENVLGIRLDYRWRMAIQMIIDYPLSGVGIGAYIVESPNYLKPVRIKVYLVKNLFEEMRLLDEFTINTDIWKTYILYLPEEVDQEIMFLIKVDRTWNPQKNKGAPDPRNLGVGTGRIRFKHDMT